MEDPFKLKWDIRREGRSWIGDEVMERYAQRCPEAKIELIDGKLFWQDDERLMLLALLLENVGIDKAIQLGDLAVWRAAILEASSSTCTHPATYYNSETDNYYCKVCKKGMGEEYYRAMKAEMEKP